MSISALHVINETSPIKNEFINYESFEKNRSNWLQAKPFNHIVLDNFLNEKMVELIMSEFPNYDSKSWHEYNNPLEIKKTCNNWNSFGANTYKLFGFLNSEYFINLLEDLVQCKLFPDFGLNGGGLHTHKSGGKLNTHLDYSMHPKLPLQRKLNLIIYITPNWDEKWGGQLGLWSNNTKTNKPDKLIKSITPKFNRAVLFDTSQNSWHGLPDEIRMPDGTCRNSLATYYLCKPATKVDPRSKALFHPSEKQKNSLSIRKLIAQRADTSTHKSTYII